MENKRNTVFISHAKEDVELVKDLHTLIMKVISDLNIDMSVFFSHINLNTSGKNWKDQIIDAMKESFHCVVVLTRNSIKSEWVNFEIGLATAQENIKISGLKVSGIDPNKIDLLKDRQIRDMSNKTHIEELLKEIFYEERTKNAQKFTLILANKDTRDLINLLTYKAKERCIYIVGNKPKKVQNKNWNNLSNQFVKNISERLLNKNFKLASFPYVDYVGKAVFDAVSKNGQLDKYEIAGLYNFDKSFDSDNVLKDNKEMWEEVLSAFRKIYLRNKESIIIIGGGEGTKKECRTAKKIPGIQLFPIPCFGGIASELFKEFAAKNHPCENCKQREATYNEKCIESIVERLEKI